MAGFGLKITRSTGPDGFVGNQTKFDISPANANPIFTGDPVILSSGFIVEATGAADNNDFTILGVFQGCQYVDADGSYKFRKYWDGAPNRTQIKAFVAIPDGATFLIKGTPAGTYTQANIGQRFGLDYTVGSTVYGDSRSRLAAATAATGPLIINRLVEAPFNSFDSDEPLFEVVVARKQGYPALV